MYTKGKWKTRHPVNNDISIYTGEYGKGITQVALLFESSPNAEDNAHLIASAPDMYEACLGLLNFIRDKYPDDFKEGGQGFICPHHRAIERALAKAGGL